MERERLIWIDNLKCICILFVMLSHLQSGRSIPQALYQPFFLTGFLFAAGYVYRAGSDFKGFLKKKLQGLFVPWLVFSVGNILLSQVFSFQAHGPVWQELKWNFLQIRGEGDGLWFLAALFVAFVPFYWLIRSHEQKETDGAMGLLLLTLGLSVLSDLYTMSEIRLPWGTTALPWHLEYVCRAVFFMTVGYLSRKHGFSPNGILAGGIYFLAVLPEFLAWPLPMAVELIRSYTAQLAGVYALANLSRCLPGSRLMSCIGGNTLLCFALHGKVLSALEWTLRHFDWYAAVLQQPVCAGLLALGLTALMALILLLPIWIINRWFGFLLGRKRRKP